MRFALSGYGWAAAMHADAISLAGHEVAGVSGPNDSRRDAFAAARRIPVSARGAAEMLRLAEPDVLVVCSPNSCHLGDALAAVDAGVHVMVEKPVTVTLAECHELEARAKDAGVTVGVGHMWRHRDEVIAFRDRIAAGEFGRVVRTHGWGVHAGWGPAGWFVDPVLAGGGALIDMGIHAIDTARFLLGDPEPVRVQASIGRGVFSDVDVDDDGVVMIDWDNGVRSVIEFGWWQPVLGGLEADTEVFGTAGNGRIWPDFAGFGAEYRHCSVGMYERQIADFVDACRTGREPLASLAAGRTALAIVRAAYDAAG